MRSFSEISIFDYCDRLKVSIKTEIEGKSKEYILGVDEKQFQDYLIDKYVLEPLAIDFQKEIIDIPVVSKEWVEDRFFGEKHEVESYKFKITYPFTGSSKLFSIAPSTRHLTSNEITVDESQQNVSFSFKMTSQNPEEFLREKNEGRKNAFVNLDNVNYEARQWNSVLPNLVKTYFDDRKTKYQKENDFYAAINIPINQNTSSVFTAPTIRKRDIPQPKVDPKKEYSSEPLVSTVMYEDILKIVYDTGKGMERKPSLYIGKDEEALRDIFLLLLETRYDSISVSGETFNRSGKTDIILKYAKDGSNLFVAECKFWHGFKAFLETISQLFDRYLSWRDSKVAIMMFVKNNDFTSVMKNISTETRNHPYYVKDNGRRGESSFSYIFRLPQDPDKQVYLEVMAFHYDK
ncbi:hypothetical protein FPZ42_02630 [Mucilaginibacter achroorhodeus]|uniref:Uncharacterized protein n=1 Tax=Mucilaginibacter achroorhodeus TaxID=2599294 RepID=A0A563U9X3_9SPHI|nr:hypothetical protein [Mucilaginibacter achroorhodeus]TWR28130.1 hypothetical protein FPZ42_02630 [Mucilaginibacter achroorhodeus]